MAKRSRFFGVNVVLLLLWSVSMKACGGSAPTPTFPPQSTVTYQPTSEVSPSTQPSPTPTSTETLTPTPTPTDTPMSTPASTDPPTPVFTDTPTPTAVLSSIASPAQRSYRGNSHMANLHFNRWNLYNYPGDQVYFRRMLLLAPSFKENWRDSDGSW
jgi:hypothetical protein